MKERPILFKGQMVRDILAGVKTQTRRIIKPQPRIYFHSIKCGAVDDFDGNIMFGFCSEDDKWVFPYGVPGDRLWVRETFCDTHLESSRKPWTYLSDESPEDRYMYPLKWKPSIFMPRAASRITLEITGVRVERLNQISEEDAVAEGCIPFMEHSEDCSDEHCALAGGVHDCDGSMVSAKMLYRQLWIDINGPGSWDKNPWVWVIEFRKL
jgi:hypothetical protein